MRRSLAILITALAAVGADCESAAAATATSSNWAGYVAGGAAAGFTRVSASWIEPAVSCTAGSPTYMASWVGLGGSSQGSNALEQVGTEADCSAGGRATYSSWFELVPAVSGSAHLRVAPGDVISASVRVRGRSVTLRMADATQGTVFLRRLRASAVDVTSAEWIVEAPSVCLTASASTCRDTNLADFGSTAFTRARATAAGHTGTIADAAWSATGVTLARGGPPRGGGQAAASAGLGTAVPGALTPIGDQFSVIFGAGSAAGGGGF